MRAFLLAALVFAAARVFAQDGASPAPAFSQVLERLSAVQTLRGNFTQTREVPGLSAVLQSGGRFIVSGEGLYWEQLRPFRSVLIADEERLVQIVGNQAPTLISAAEAPVVGSVGSVFLSVFRGDRAALEEHFEIDFDTTGSEWSVGLEPTSYPLTETIDRLELRGHLFIEQLTLVGTAGDVLTAGFHDLSDEPEQLSLDERALYSP